MLGDSQKFSPLYRNYPLEKRNEKIKRSMIIIHGAGRNAHDYFSTGMAAAFLAGALENTIVISPRYAVNNCAGCKDTMAADEIAWECRDWKNGYEALNQKGVYSYDLLDKLLKQLSDEKIFPSLKGIVVSGHSVDGQITQRYVAANNLHEALRVPVRYVVSNPQARFILTRCVCPATFIATPRAIVKRNFAAMATVATAPSSELDTLPIAGFDRYDLAKGSFVHVKIKNAPATESRSI